VFHGGVLVDVERNGRIGEFYRGFSVIETSRRREGEKKYGRRGRGPGGAEHVQWRAGEIKTGGGVGGGEKRRFPVSRVI